MGYDNFPERRSQQVDSEGRGHCVRCTFWQNKGSNFGPCLRYPPRCNDDGKTSWPYVEAHDRCGEFVDHQGRG